MLVFCSPKVAVSPTGMELGAHSAALAKLVAPMSSRNSEVRMLMAEGVSFNGVSMRPPASALAAV
jgi:hypothetical protein